MTKYIVNVVMSTCVAIEVEAQSIAIEEAVPFTADDWNYDIDCVFRDDDEDGEMKMPKFNVEISDNAYYPEIEVKSDGMTIYCY